MAIYKLVGIAIGSKKQEHRKKEINKKMKQDVLSI